MVLDAWRPFRNFKVHKLFCSIEAYTDFFSVGCSRQYSPKDRIIRICFQPGRVWVVMLFSSSNAPMFPLGWSLLSLMMQWKSLCLRIWKCWKLPAVFRSVPQIHSYLKATAGLRFNSNRIYLIWVVGLKLNLKTMKESVWLTIFGSIFETVYAIYLLIITPTVVLYEGAVFFDLYCEAAWLQRRSTCVQLQRLLCWCGLDPRGLVSHRGD